MTTQNRIRERIENADYVLGAKLRTASPILIEVCGSAGLDYVWIDFEHKGRSPEDGNFLQNLARTAENVGINLLARLPRSDPDLVRKVLDSGISSILISRVEEAKQIRQAIKASRFTYDDAAGSRGASASYINRWGSESTDYTEVEDQNVLVGAMIETEAGYDNIDDILDVPGLGFTWFGSGDMTVSLGIPLNQRNDHPEVRRIMTELEEQCSESGIPMGKTAYKLSGVVEAINDGYQIINICSDADTLHKQIRSRREEIESSLNS